MVGLPELKEETGDKVYWCVRVQWWEKVKKQEAWRLKEGKGVEEVYASALTDVIVEMRCLVHDGISDLSTQSYVPSEKSNTQIEDTVTLWKK